MRIVFPNTHRPRQSRRGYAVLVLLALISFMLVLVAANNNNLNWLRQEVKLVNKRQIERLALSATNRPPAAASATNSPPSR